MELTEVYTIISDTEKRIAREYGMAVSLRPVFHSMGGDVWDDCLRVIAAALGMDYALYTTKTRMKYAVYMRHIAAFLLKEYYPKLSYADLGRMFGKDHTTIVHGVQTCKNLLDARDEEVTAMYEKASAAVKVWYDNKINDRLK